VVGATFGDRRAGPLLLLYKLRDRITGLTVVGGLTGPPQVSIPGA
jgi:hypothetical protein